MNLLLGILLMILMLSTGGDLIGSNVIHSMTEDSVSAQYGLQEGDRFLEIDGHHVWSDLDLSFLLRAPTTAYLISSWSATAKRSR